MSSLAALFCPFYKEGSESKQDKKEMEARTPWYHHMASLVGGRKSVRMEFPSGKKCSSNTRIVASLDSARLDSTLLPFAYYAPRSQAHTSFCGALLVFWYVHMI